MSLSDKIIDVQRNSKFDPNGNVIYSSDVREAVRELKEKLATSYSYDNETWLEIEQNIDEIFGKELV